MQTVLFDRTQRNELCLLRVVVLDRPCTHVTSCLLDEQALALQLRVQGQHTSAASKRALFREAEALRQRVCESLQQAFPGLCLEASESEYSIGRAEVDGDTLAVFEANRELRQCHRCD